jgi:sulfhydrogenase subunit beta (sulfur reductase)
MPKSITQDKLTDWLDIISQKYKLWVPQDKNGICQLELYEKGVVLNLERVPRFSAKKVVFPQTECMLKYSFQKNYEDPEKVALSLESTHPQAKTVVWGIPPCDVAGISFLEKVLTGSGYHDPYFKARRNECLIVALACQQPDNTCFCTAVGGSPVEAPDADLLLTRTDHEYVVEALTPQGAKLIDEKLFAMPDEDKLQAIKQAKGAVRSSMASPFSIKSLPVVADKIRQAFENPYWKETVAGCLGCGICTFVCPTCYCFNIADESHGMRGERLRCWDACMFPLYSLEASGHNPRALKFQRYRNRLSHKFSYLITNNNTLGCTGCGRCIRQCPAGIDMRHIIAYLLGEG